MVAGGALILTSGFPPSTALARGPPLPRCAGEERRRSYSRRCRAPKVDSSMKRAVLLHRASGGGGPCEAWWRGLRRSRSSRQPSERRRRRFHRAPSIRRRRQFAQSSRPAIRETRRGAGRVAVGRLFRGPCRRPQRRAAPWRSRSRARRPDRMLSPECRHSRCAVSQTAPKHRLRRRETAAQTAGRGDGCWRRSHFSFRLPPSTALARGPPPPLRW